MLDKSILDMSLKITKIRLQPYQAGANEFSIWIPAVHVDSSLLADRITQQITEILSRLHRYCLRQDPQIPTVIAYNPVYFALFVNTHAGELGSTLRKSNTWRQQSQIPLP